MGLLKIISGYKWNLPLNEHLQGGFTNTLFVGRLLKLS